MRQLPQLPYGVHQNSLSPSMSLKVQALPNGRKDCFLEWVS